MRTSFFGLARFLQKLDVDASSPNAFRDGCRPDSDLWPCPLPPPLDDLRGGVGARRRSRWRSRRLVRRIVRFTMGVLNWMALGKGAAASSHPALRSAPSAAQCDVWRRIEDRIGVWVRLARDAGSGLGRAQFKFDAIDAETVRVEEELVGFRPTCLGMLFRGRAVKPQRKMKRDVCRRGFGGRPQLRNLSSLTESSSTRLRASTPRGSLATRFFGLCI